MIIQFFLFGLLAFIVSFVATVLVKHFAFAHNIVDKPVGDRKIHTRTVARLGGLAIFIGFVAVLILVLKTTNVLTSGLITHSHYTGVIVAGLILMLGGFLDDRFELPPRSSVIAPTLATLTLIFFGVEIEKLTNPLGGVVYLTAWQSDLIVFTWLMVVMYTTKFLDGLDGLATSVSSVGLLMILLLSLTTAYFQSDVAMLSSIALGAFIGFLFWNLHPASIFLGEGGSTFTGFLLGTLAVISGGKLAIALLVLGIPLLDVFWILIRRFRKGGIREIFKGDKKHLHHRLLDLGWGQLRIMLTYVFIAGVFGSVALFLQSREKLVALILLGVLMLVCALVLVQREKRYA